MSYFWSGNDLKNFIFTGFNINSNSELTGVFFGVLGVAVVYEGIRTLRDSLLYRFLSTTIVKGVKSANDIPLQVQDNLGYTKSRGNSIQEECVDSKTNASESELGYQNKIKNGNGNSPPEKEEKAGNENAVDATSPIDNIEVCPEPNVFTCSSSEPSGSKKQKKAFTLLFLSSLLHMCYICCGYGLMLAVMTFNVWILLSVVLGVGIGFLLCDTVRRSNLARHSNISWLTPRRGSDKESAAAKK